MTKFHARSQLVYASLKLANMRCKNVNIYLTLQLQYLSMDILLLMSSSVNFDMTLHGVLMNE